MVLTKKDQIELDENYDLFELKNKIRTNLTKLDENYDKEIF